MPDDPIAEYRALHERATTHSQGVISPDVTALLEAFPRLVDVAEAAMALDLEWIMRTHPSSDVRQRAEELRAALSKLGGKTNEATRQG